jgi:iron transport multicopper oxidase
VQDNSWAVIRFRADNPGVWLLHCHIEFHVNAGFVATIIEAPEVLAEKGFAVPKDHIDSCKKFPMAYQGNAAGNIGSPLDLSEANTQLSTPDYGAMYPPGTAPHAADYDSTHPGSMQPGSHPHRS